MYALTSAGTLKWSYFTGGGIASAAVIANDGSIRIISHDGHLYALTSEGILKWKHVINDVESSSSGILIDSDNTVYLGNSTGFLAINAAGALKWSKPNVPFSNMPAMGEDGTLYVSYKTVVAINKKNGLLKWTFSPRNVTTWLSPAIGADGTIYTLGRSYPSLIISLYAVHTNGTLKWTLLLSTPRYYVSPIWRRWNNLYCFI